MTDARTPDPAVAAALVADLARHGIACALGGSGLLAALGLERHVRDWDLTTDAAEEEVRRAVAGRDFERFGSSGVHADSKLVFAEGPIDLIVRFALAGERGVVRIPTVITGEWHGLPLGSAEAWAVAYAMMERTEKSERLFAHLARHGAAAAIRDRLLAEPLPVFLADRLRALA